MWLHCKLSCRCLGVVQLCAINILYKITAQRIAVSPPSVTEMRLVKSCSSVVKETAVIAGLFSIATE